MHHPTDRITHTTTFVTPVVEHWLEREIAQWEGFQDDNARVHRVRIVTAHLQQHDIYGLPWPAMSPDLSPKVHVWDMVGRRVRQRQRPPTTLAELGQALQEEWNRLPHPLGESYPVPRPLLHQSWSTGWNEKYYFKMTTKIQTAKYNEIIDRLKTQPITTTTTTSTHTTQ